VRAIFTMTEGELADAVQKEGVLAFVDEAKLLPKSGAGTTSEVRASVMTTNRRCHLPTGRQ
jgi:hypothetical protein